jgi:hypothetical protein
MLKALIICVLLWVNGGHGATDMTLTDRATGSEVVDAVVDLIHQSCIFDDDRLLLRRIAYVETQDGAASNTFLNDGSTFYGGIWQVSMYFVSLQKYCTGVLSLQGIRMRFRR